MATRDAILEGLKEKCRTASHPSELWVPIWSFNHVHDYPRNAHWPEGPPHAYALERGEADAQKVEQIHQNGWREFIGIDDEDSGYLLFPKPIFQVLKKSDFLQQLALRFGSDYRVSMSPPEVFTVTSPSGEDYYRSKITLQLHVYPNGLSEHFRKLQREHILTSRGRVRRTVGSTEAVKVWKKPEPEPVVVRPEPRRWPSALPEGMTWAPPSRADNSFHHRGCYCGCDDSDDESVIYFNK